MTQPRRRAWFLRLARWYVRRRIRRAFDGVFVSGLAEVRERARNGPLVFAMNHVSGWDAFVVVVLDEVLGTESYCLMDADNLERLPFCGWIGAVPLRRTHPRSALVDLRLHARLLDGPGKVGWIFPQGEQRPPRIRPLGLQRGVGIFAAESRAPVIPVSLSYTFRDAPEPAVVVTLGAPCAVPRNAPPEELERRLVAGLDANDRFVLAGGASFDLVVPPRRRGGVPMQGRLLARMGGGTRV